MARLGECGTTRLSRVMIFSPSQGRKFLYDSAILCSYLARLGECVTTRLCRVIFSPNQARKLSYFKTVPYHAFYELFVGEKKREMKSR